MNAKVSILILIVTVIATGLLISGCGDDPAYRPTPPGNQASNFKNLQNKDDVLYNLELAYNKRNFEEFEKLLDDDFVFILSESDYNSGEVDAPQWDRVRELSVNQQIFDPNLDSGLRVISIDLSLDYSAGNWTPLPPDTNHPTETWYTQTVGYDLITKTADDWEHRALDLNAQLTVRKNDSTGLWQIVLWRDDVGSQMGLSPGRIAVESTTWGGIKAQYE